MRTLFFFMLLAAMAATLPAHAADTIDITGEWQITIESSEGTFQPVAVIKQEGDKLTGRYKGRFGETKLEGTIKEKSVKWSVKATYEGQEFELVYSGTVETESTMKGEVAAGDAWSATWTAKKTRKE